MKSSWLLLLMTPLFAYANYELDDLYDCDYFSDAIVIEGEPAFVDEYTDLYADALYEMDVIPDLDEDFFEEDEVVAAPVSVKKENNKRTPSKANSSRRAKELRQNGNRPQVTHLQADDALMDEQNDLDPSFQGDIAEDEEGFYEEVSQIKKKEQVRSKSSPRSVVRKEAVGPVNKRPSLAQKEEVLQKREALRSKANTAARKEQLEAQRRGQVKSNPSRQVVVEEEMQKPARAPRRAASQKEHSSRSGQVASQKRNAQAVKQKQMNRTPLRRAPAAQAPLHGSSKDSKADKSQMMTRREKLNERNDHRLDVQKKQAIVKSKPQKRWAVPSREEIEDLKEEQRIAEKRESEREFSEERNFQARAPRQERVYQPKVASKQAQPRTRGTHRGVSRKSAPVVENQTAQVEEEQQRSTQKRVRSYRTAKRPVSD